MAVLHRLSKHRDMYMLVFPNQNEELNHDIKTANKFLDNVVKFGCLGSTVTIKNVTHKGI
jgi:hypothetical protein